MPNILLVTHTPPLPATNGGAQRTNLLIRALQRCGNVKLILVPRNEWEAQDTSLQESIQQELCPVEIVALPRDSRPWKRYWKKLVYTAFPSKRYDIQNATNSAFRRELDACKYDLIVGRYLLPSAVSGMLKQDIPVVINIDDLDSHRLQTRVEQRFVLSPRALLERRELRVLKALQDNLLNQADHVWVSAAEDLAFLPSQNGSVLPNIPFYTNSLHSALASSATSKEILFVGSLLYQVNVRALQRFLTSIWPSIINQCPDATFRIVGVGMTPAQTRAWQEIPGVIASGFVPDLSTVYRTCAFTICPIWEGGGTKIKVLESFSFGRTSVVSAHAARGFQGVFEHLQSYMVAANDSEFATHCAALIRDAEVRTRMALLAQQRQQENFGFDHFCSVVETDVARLVSSGKTH